MDQNRPDNDVDEAERNLAYLIKQLTPAQAANYRLAANAVAAVVDRYGAAGLLAVWMSSALYAREAEQISAEYGNQFSPGELPGANNQSDS